MPSPAWVCVRTCIHVAPAVLGAWIALHPVPIACEVRCHWAIPPAEFQPGGMFWQPPVALLPPADRLQGLEPRLTPSLWPHPGPPEAVPEPGTLGPLAAALGALAYARGRRRGRYQHVARLDHGNDAIP
jgi:hypothetical protein